MIINCADVPRSGTRPQLFHLHFASEGFKIDLPCNRQLSGEEFADCWKGLTADGQLVSDCRTEVTHPPAGGYEERDGMLVIPGNLELLLSVTSTSSINWGGCRLGSELATELLFPMEEIEYHVDAHLMKVVKCCGWEECLRSDGRISNTNIFRNSFGSLQKVS